LEVLYLISKWNYLNTDNYEKGFGYVMGLQWDANKINDKFMLDLFFWEEETNKDFTKATY
jgi:hypothetical protein